MSFGRRGILAGALALAFLLAVVAPAASPAAVYWGDNGSIGAANFDGTSPNPDYFKPNFFSDSFGPYCGLAASDSYLYWAGAFGIGRVNLDGPAAPATVSPRLNQPCGIAINASHLYWAEPSAGVIGRANLDGSAPNTALVTGLDHPCGVAVDGSYLYWVSWRGIGRARLDGLFPRSDFITGLGGVAGIAVDRDRIYWVDQVEGMVYSTIGRADIDGSDVNRAFLQTETFNSGGVAVDARAVPSPRPLPSWPPRFGQVRHNPNDGSVVLDVYVPRRGDLVVTAPKVGWKVLKGNPPPYLEGTFRWRLKVWPGKTRFGKKLRIQLRNKGRAPVALRISYAETGQLAATAVRRVALLKRRPT